MLTQFRLSAYTFFLPDSLFDAGDGRFDPLRKANRLISAAEYDIGCSRTASMIIKKREHCGTMNRISRLQRTIAAERRFKLIPRKRLQPLSESEI